MAYILGEPTVQQYVDANGDPLVNGTIEFYLTGTSTPTNIYSDSSGTSAGTSVTLNSIGAPENSGTAIALFFDTDITYKIVRKDSAGTTINPTIDPFQMGDASDTYYNQGGTGATTRTVTSRLQERVSVLDFGAVADDSTDNATAFQAAIDAVVAAGGGTVWVPEGVYKSGQIILYPKVRLIGEGRMQTQLKQISTDGNSVHFILCKPDGGAQVSPTVAPVTVIKDLYISGEKGSTASTDRDGIHCAAASEDPSYTGTEFYRGVHIENCEVTLCEGSGIYIGPERQQSYIQYSRTTFNVGRGIYINSANDCNIGPKVGSGSNDHHSLLISAGSAPAITTSQFWESTDDTKHAVFFTLCGWPFISNCIIEGDNDEVMRVDGGYGVSGGILETQPQGGVIVGCTFKNSATATGQNGWIQVNNTPNLIVSGCNFAPKDGNTPPTYIIYEQDVVGGTESSVILQSATQQAGGTKYYGTGICNTREVVAGWPLEIRKRVVLADIAGNITWDLNDGNYQYVSNVSGAATVTISQTGSVDGRFFLIVGGGATNLTMSGHDYATAGGTSPTSARSVIIVDVVGAFMYLEIVNYT